MRQCKAEEGGVPGHVDRRTLTDDNAAMADSGKHNV